MNISKKKEKTISKICYNDVLGGGLMVLGTLSFDFLIVIF